MLPKRPETAKDGHNKVNDVYVFVPIIVDRNAKKTHCAGLENTATPQFKIKITKPAAWKIGQYRNTAILQTPS